ncbi:MAG TPA: C4-dicarboxylate ABC transporter substrate-binding protein [Gemmatimonadetes bacterium]|nr:C4-dicarboxylate ABC transporter substrate-binding protein [Gemmatimonadota bacterium]|tara:strand:+ start:236 stop:817 length:582 start_codon:yes stop_codon:yes gene_type:complete
MSFLRRAAAVVDRLNDLMGSATSWLVLAMVLMGAYNALARWATRYVGIPLSSNALNEIQWYMFSIIFLLGAAHGLRHDVHVRVDVLRERLVERGRAWIDLFGTTLMLVPFCVLMLWVSWTPVVRSWQVREVSPDPGGLPRWPIKALLLVCFGLLLLQGLAMAVRQLDTIRERGTPEGPRIGPDAAGVRQEEGS